MANLGMVFITMIWGITFVMVKDALNDAPPFTFLWSNGSASDSIYNLYAGTYSVVITDVNGCSSSISTNLTEAPLSIKEYVSQKKCLKVVTLLGMETKVKANQTLFYIYDDGTVEKRIIIE